MKFYIILKEGKKPSKILKPARYIPAGFNIFTKN